MFIVECLPFSRSLNAESLSYFSTQHFEAGSLVRINLRGKNVPALVVSSKDAAELKTEIRSASFQLKKIGASISKPFLGKNFLKAVNETAGYFVATTGGVLYHLIPSFILENPRLISAKNYNQKSGKMTEQKTETLILQASEEERFSNYRLLIREEFAKKKSVFICLPQNEDVRQAKERLSRGIETYVASFQKEMTKKELKTEWQKTSNTDHPVLIIGTAKWLCVGRDDIGTIIIDKENENGWKTLSRPFIDLRFFVESYAQKIGARCIIGDSFLTIETLYRYRENKLRELDNLKWRLTSDLKTYLIDLKTLTKKEKDFRIISDDLLTLIEETAKKGAHTFIFAARKGLAPMTICRDCGEQVKCSNCASAMILYKIKDGGLFKCPQCGETRDASEVCQKCGSWKLAAYGVGVDRVAQELKEKLPNLNLFEMNKDVVDSSTKAIKIMGSFYNTRGGVLLGTELAFSYLQKKINTAIIASFDSLFFVPDYKIREKIFRLILQTKEIAKENFLIQTRNPEEETVKLALTGDLLGFYNNETEDRKILEYPPYGIFIKITTRGSKNFVTKEIDNLKKILAKLKKSPDDDQEVYGQNHDYKTTLFSSSQEKKGEQAAVNAVIKIPRENWPDKKIISVLKTLPLHFEIKIDPDNLL